MLFRIGGTIYDLPSCSSWTVADVSRDKARAVLTVSIRSIGLADVRMSIECLPNPNYEVDCTAMI